MLAKQNLRYLKFKKLARILSVNEHWLSDPELSMTVINGLKLVANFCRVNKAQGSVGNSFSGGTAELDFEMAGMEIDGILVFTIISVPLRKF